MWIIKSFEELTAKELHLIYKERTAVFVVEQNCPYQEVDDTDLVSIHFFKQLDDRLLAYARLIPEPDSVRIGRVLVPQSERTHGYGQELMQIVLEYAKLHFPELPIHAQAQAYLQQFYASFGFRPVSEIYLEDDIPHIDMIINPQNNQVDSTKRQEENRE
ncbi:GNAT family N-acetyltransferase [Trichococcus ilyis]|uniref:Acyl-coa n-acyltransferase n=1 Tax=Trichococcus ilyis TaxID=640938 RepID=A0A143YTV1_9LACT|nr:GNAT family N-acetyltransferase [Trichococcus ilyis]CZQ96934.1 acyl-coa n-acyltransferase [Trichococcus ilyis]SEJ53242.1 ElaA protein [Trichococcus ilyis]